MAVTPTDAIATLEAALSRGVLQVTFADGKSTRYASPAEMRDAIAYFRAQQRVEAGRPAASVSIGAFFRE